MLTSVGVHFKLSAFMSDPVSNTLMNISHKPGPPSRALCGALCALSIAMVLYLTDPLIACCFYLYFVVCFCFNT